MSTPEGLVKDEVKQILLEFGLIAAAKAPNVGPEHTGWYFMPVSNGMGVSGIPDFIGHFFGLFFSIETKGDLKKNPTPLQQHQIKAIDTTGARNFIIRDVKDTAELINWLTDIRNVHAERG